MRVPRLVVAMMSPNGVTRFCLGISAPWSGTSLSQRRPLVGDERQVVPHMTDGLEHQLPQREQAGLAVDGDTEPRLLRLQPQDACGVPPQGGEQIELFGEIERLVAEPLGV